MGAIGDMFTDEEDYLLLLGVLRKRVFTLEELSEEAAVGVPSVLQWLRERTDVVAHSNEKGKASAKWRLRPRARELVRKEILRLRTAVSGEDRSAPTVAPTPPLQSLVVAEAYLNDAAFACSVSARRTALEEARRWLSAANRTVRRWRQVGVELTEGDAHRLERLEAELAKPPVESPLSSWRIGDFTRWFLVVSPEAEGLPPRFRPDAFLEDGKPNPRRRLAPLLPQRSELQSHARLCFDIGLIIAIALSRRSGPTALATKRKLLAAADQITFATLAQSVRKVLANHGYASNGEILLTGLGLHVLGATKAPKEERNFLQSIYNNQALWHYEFAIFYLHAFQNIYRAADLFQKLESDLILLVRSYDNLTEEFDQMVAWASRWLSTFRKPASQLGRDAGNDRDEAGSPHTPSAMDRILASKAIFEPDFAAA